MTVWSRNIFRHGGHNSIPSTRLDDGCTPLSTIGRSVQQNSEAIEGITSHERVSRLNRQRGS
ncbi:MAG: hypothetical protein O3B86_13375, partial [Planctomycetota bacterium]|nr:hypothetical protein [Planctomycetota bacterium]